MKEALGSRASSSEGTYMKRSSPNEIMNSLSTITVFRGIYKRVAKRLDIDPSYVSRVARGERRAAFVTEALKKEIRRALGKVRFHDGYRRAA